MTAERQTTDEDLSAIRARMDGMDFVPTERLIQYHQLIQMCRLADAAERAALAQELSAVAPEEANVPVPPPGCCDDLWRLVKEHVASLPATRLWTKTEGDLWNYVRERS